MLRLIKRIASTVGLFAATFGLAGELNAGTIDIFGLPNTSLGSATLQVVNGTLVVSNIGPSGADGVSVGLPSTTTDFGATFADFGTAGSNPIGSFLKLTAIGTVNGIANQVISTNTATDLGNSVAVNITSPVTSGPLFVRYFLAGNFIASEITPASSTFTMADWPKKGRITYFDSCGICIDIHIGPLNDAEDVLTPDGELLFVDDIEIESTALNATFGGYSSASLTTGGGISSFTILDEQLQTTPEASSFFLLCSGLAALALAGRRPYQKSKQTTGYAGNDWLSLLKTATSDARLG